MLRQNKPLNLQNVHLIIHLYPIFAWQRLEYHTYSLNDQIFYNKIINNNDDNDTNNNNNNNTINKL